MGKKPKGQKPLLLLGILIVIVASIYTVFHNDRPYNSNPNACVNHTFSLGSRGYCVSDGQNLINWYLYGSNNANYIKINGKLNTLTVTAVKKVQSGASLEVNGKIDFETWKLLCSNSGAPKWWYKVAKDAGCP